MPALVLLRDVSGGQRLALRNSISIRNNGSKQHLSLLMKSKSTAPAGLKQFPSAPTHEEAKVEDDSDSDEVEIIVKTEERKLTVSSKAASRKQSSKDTMHSRQQRLLRESSQVDVVETEESEGNAMTKNIRRLERQREERKEFIKSITLGRNDLSNLNSFLHTSCLQATSSD